ncbi:MAG: hypothetical protein ACRENU_07730 [Gemmatimonadaceae bacterium]
MIKRNASIALWVAAAGCLVAAAARYRTTDVALTTVLPKPLLVAPAMPLWPEKDSLLDAAERIVAANPFGSARSQLLQAGQAGPQPMPMTPAQPLLRGIVGGPPWIAVVLGLPNTQGAVALRMGDTVSGFSIVRARADTVVLRGPGATYTLTRRSP